MIRQIGQGTFLGRILGHGALLTGRVPGVRRIPAIKRQASPGYGPRALKGNGVTYVTSRMGADHTAGNAFETLNTVNPLKPAGQVAVSRKLQIRAALLDTLGFCIFVRPPFLKKPEMFANLLRGRYGWEMTVSAGVSEEFYPMPKFMQDEPLPPNNVVFDVPNAEMRTIGGHVRTYG